jgi:hypothetical protein
MTFAPQPLRQHSFPLREVLVTTAVTLLLVGIAVLSFFQARQILQGPVISLQTDAEVVTDSQIVTVSGTTENIAFMWVNGKKAYTDSKGNFDYTVIAPVGSSVIKINAVDRSDNETAVYVPVYVEETAPFATESFQQKNIQ